MTRTLRCQTLALAIAAVLSAPMAAQSDRTEQTLPFEVDKAATLTTTAGPVKVTSLRIANLGRGYSRGGLSLRSTNPPSELSTTLRMTFDVQNPLEQEWEVTFTVEFMDKDGKVIDRATKKEDYEDETAALQMEHPLLEYVLPFISEVRVTVHGRRS